MQRLVLIAVVLPLVQASQSDLLHEGLAATKTNPLLKVLSMFQSMQTKLIEKGAASQKMYNEKAKFCEDRARSLSHEIKTGKAQVASLKATIDQKSADITVQTSKIETLSSDIGTDENDLKAATGIRKKENDDFKAEEREMIEMVQTLERAISVFSKKAAEADGGASMLQTKGSDGIIQALTAMVDATSMSGADASKLTALVQEQSEEQSQDDDEFSSYIKDGAPPAAAYKTQSGSIVTVLEGLLEKSSGQLEESRKAEANARHNFDMVKQSLTDELKFANKDMTESKTTLAEAQEAKSGAEGNLAVTSKDLAGDIAAKGALHHECMTSATDFQVAMKSRGEEIKALMQGQKILQESTGGAAAQTYSADFLQLASHAKLKTKSDLAKFEAVRYVRDLAKRHKSHALAQLASRMSSAMRLSAESQVDPFKKVKGLITGMLVKLEGDAADEASHKAYCDKEMSETTAKLEDKTSDTQNLGTKVQQKKAASKKLQQEVGTLQSELAGLASSQAKATRMRQAESAVFKKSKPEMEEGLRGVKMGMKVIKDYYSIDGEGEEGTTASTLLGIMEVVEADFSKGYSELVADEENAAADYEFETNANQVETVAKNQDVKYKTRAFKSLEKTVAELSGDLAGSQAELDAVLEYDGRIKQACIGKALPYEEAKKRRDAELAGLKEAISILEGNSLIQRNKSPINEAMNEAVDILKSPINEAVGILGDTSLIQRSSKRTLRGAFHHQVL